MQADYLGQLVAPPANQGLTPQANAEIKQAFNGRVVEVLVTSNNNLKKQAAKDSVVAWLKELFKQRIDVNVKGYGVSSNIDEQPHGLDHTRLGAMNRLANLKTELHSKENIGQSTQDGVLRVLVSLENGIMQENVPNVKNAPTFITDGQVWVDRCIEAVEIWLQGRCWNAVAISEGVTTPREQVEQAAGTNWTQTAGKFIEQKYRWPNADWHGDIAGKGRKLIMEELAKAALGVSSYTMQIPKNFRTYHPTNDRDKFLQYNTQAIDFFTSTEIDDMLQNENNNQRSGTDWRKYYTYIPQPNKEGPLKKTIHTSGPVLTEDLLVGYFAEVEDPQTKEKKDVLHIVLRWSKDAEGGWVLPGKLDRAYTDKNPIPQVANNAMDVDDDDDDDVEESKNGDISVQDANFALMEKEIGLQRTDIAAHVVLSCFDDRKREQRMITTSMMSFMLMSKKPKLIPGEKIGVPLNALLKLVQGEIRIPRNPWDTTGAGMGRNHDSLLLNVFKTAAFYSTMDKVKRQQVQYKQQLAQNPNAPYPPLPIIDEPYECKVCFDVMVKATSTCAEGHDVCGICLRTLELCHICRGDLAPRPNRGLDEAVKLKYPDQYAERFRLLEPNPPPSWRNDPTFNGFFIHY